jgi:hypothetical protein
VRLSVGSTPFFLAPLVSLSPSLAPRLLPLSFCMHSPSVLARSSLLSVRAVGACRVLSRIAHFSTELQFESALAHRSPLSAAGKSHHRRALTSYDWRQDK